jgi:predicted permease
MSLDFGRERRSGVSFPNYLDIGDRNQVFTGVAAMRAMPMALGVSNGDQSGTNNRIWGYLVSGSYFDLLGVVPWRGRFLTPEDDGKAPGPVAVLSYGCWQSRFAADPQIVGRLVKVNGERFTVVGVAPPGFIGTERFYASEIWVPFSTIGIIEGRDWRPDRMTRNAWTVGRLKPGVSVKQAEASLGVLAAQMARDHPGVSDGFAIHLSPPGLLGSTLRGPAIGFGFALMLVSGLTLLVACTNLSGLVLANAADRRKEMAIRLAIGAGRGMILRLMLVESVVLGVAGGALGLLAAVWLSDGVQAWLPASQFPIAKFEPDWRVIAFGIGAALITTTLSALLPSLRAAAVDLGPTLKNETATGMMRGLHLRDIYLGIQVAVCMVLLTGSVMMVRTLRSTLEMRYGFDPEHAVALRVDMAMQGYTEEQGQAFQRRLIEKMRAIPGTEAVGLSNSIPFSIDQSSSIVTVEGKPVPVISLIPSAAMYQSGPGYFRAMGTRFIAGRDFDERDRKGAPLAVIVNQTFAEKLIPGEDPLGKRMRFGTGGPWWQIAGVVEAGRYQTITEDPQPAVWQPIEQRYNSSATVIVRSRLRDQEVLASARRVVAELNPDMPVFEAMPLREFMDFPLAPLRLSTGAITLMGALAALLCALGLYGLLAYSAVQRTREIGIRMALGAKAGDVLKLLLKRTMVLVGASAAVGIVLSLFSTRILVQFLYARMDSSTYESVLALLVVISLAASLIPARRVLKIHPSDALRHE